MNILPKKRWHVRTKENIARVRRDEAKAAEEEKEKQRRIELAEQEARTAFLREQAKQRLQTDSEKLSQGETSSVVQYEGKKNINFFNELEDGKKDWGINKEHEEEKKQEQEKYEKSIGLLTYLGQSTLDTKGEQPWYQKSHEKRLKTETDDDKIEISTKTKSFLDPLKDVRRYLDMISPKDGDAEKRKNARSSLNVKPQSGKHLKQKRNIKKEKHKKHKKKGKRKRKHNSSDSSGSNSSSSDSETIESTTKPKHTLEQLRAERLKREKEERAKAERLLAKLRGEQDSEQCSLQPVLDGQQGYNSQFNPHLAKKPKL